LSVTLVGSSFKLIGLRRTQVFKQDE